LDFLESGNAFEENRETVGEIWKAVRESGKPLKKVRKPLKKAESC
jgi:hypothetical protein